MSGIMVGIGEAVWDILPDTRRPGGAPANFAYHSVQLGHPTLLLTRVGQDDLGSELTTFWKERGLDTSCVQADQRPTGTVEVSFRCADQPEYKITEGAAWDHLEFQPEWTSLATRISAVSFGTLGQRSSQARAAIRQFLRSAPSTCLRVCDVNLRQHYYSRELIDESFKLADLIKLSEDELEEIASLFGVKETGLASQAAALRTHFSARYVAVTRGDKGSLLVTGEGVVEHPGFAVKLVDPVGAGDSFTAALTHHLLAGASPAEALLLSNRLAAWVATRRGAMPVYDTEGRAAAGV